TRRRASATSAASPQTVRSAWREISAASASRTAGWSSTIRTLVTGNDFSRHRAGDQGPALNEWFDCQLAAGKIGAVLHNPESDSVTASVDNRNADSIIPYHQNDSLFRRLQPDANFVRLSVFDRIGNRLLRNPVQVGR